MEGFKQAQRWPSPPVSRLYVSDYNFVTEPILDAQNLVIGGKLHRRKSITAFTLPKRAATGQKDSALKFIDWAVSVGANEFRFFARVDWKGPPNSGVETGWEYDEDACIWVFEQLALRGCYGEIVANTGPFGNGATTCAAHLAGVDTLCFHTENALLEVWNEPEQNGGIDLLSQVLKLYTPVTPGWASGAYKQTPYPAGRSMTTHTDRKPEWPRCFKDAFEFSTGQGPYEPFSPGFHGPVMLDEPPQIEQTIRDAVPGWSVVEDWEAYGSGGALFAAGVTAHGNPDFQQCVIPQNALVRDCTAALYRGVDAVPLQRYHGYEHPDDQGSLRRYNRWGEDGKKYQISVRPYEFQQI